MLSKYTYRGITWVDLESPTPTEVRQVMEQFDLHPLVGEELLVSSFKSKVDRYEGYLYLILHFPAFTTKIPGKTIEIDFVLGKDFIITTRYGTVDPFLRFAKIFEAESLLDRKDITPSAGYVFLYMLRHLYLALDGELETIGIDLGRIEERIFNGKEKEMVAELSRASRALLSFKQALAPHQDMLSSLEVTASRLFGSDFGHQMRSLMSDYYRIQAAVTSEREMLIELRETNNSLLSTKENEIMKVLTIMAFVTFPLSLVAAIFGMNAVHIPLIGQPGDFWMIIGIMALITTCFFGYFKHKHWL